MGFFTTRRFRCRECGHLYNFRDEEGRPVLAPYKIRALQARGVATKCPKCHPEEVRVRPRGRSRAEESQPSTPLLVVIDDDIDITEEDLGRCPHGSDLDEGCDEGCE